METPAGAGGIVIERFKNGLRLVQASWNILKADREMLALPILSMISSIALLALLFFGLFADDLELLRSGSGEVPIPTVAEWVILGVGTYVLTFVAIFFNVAQICAADDRMTGGDPTVGSAISDAMQHVRAIAPWAAVSMIVSMILRAIEERGGFLGKLAAGFLGLAWGLITYLILPVLVLEGLTVREAIARSKDLFMKTWGETVSGELGMSLVAFLAMMVSIPFLLVIGGGGQPELVMLAVVLGIAWFLLVVTAFSALNMVFRVALYRYCADGTPPEGFEHLDLGHVFPPKRKRGLFGKPA